MDEQGRAIGQRVRYWRLRRNLGRKHFADMVGRSTSWLDKIESGERNLVRLPMLERVAECLGADPSALTEEPAASRAAQCVDASEVRAIRAALGTYPELAAEDTERRLSVPKLSRQSEYLDLAWTTSRFTLVARHLPSVIRDAQQATATASTDTQLTAHRVLMNSYRLASSVLLKFEANHVAWLAADRAMRAALGTSDTWAMARATRSVARAMTSSGQRQEALIALINMSDRMRPELAARADELLTIYGMLFLAASITAAKEDNADLADQMHREATAAAARLRPEHRTHNTVAVQL